MFQGKDAGLGISPLIYNTYTAAMYSWVNEKLDFVVLFFPLEYSGWRIILRKAEHAISLENRWKVQLFWKPLGECYSENTR